MDIGKLTWHLVGLALMLIGAGILWSWPALLIVIGLWAMLNGMVDMAVKDNARLTAAWLNDDPQWQKMRQVQR